MLVFLQFYVHNVYTYARNREDISTDLKLLKLFFE